MKIIKKILKIILNILTCLLVLIIFCEATLLFQKIVLHKEYSDLFGYAEFTIVTGSMKPTINVGDDIIVKITKDVNENDIIVFKDEEDNSLVAHRLIAKEGDLVVTKGDNNNVQDEQFSKDLIVGKTVKIIPNAGNIKTTLKRIVFNRVTLLIFIDLILLCIIVRIIFKK